MWNCIVVVYYQRQHYIVKFNSFDAVQCDVIVWPCFVNQEIIMLTSKVGSIGSIIRQCNKWYTNKDGIKA